MKPDKGRQERNNYVIFMLTISYCACVLGLIGEGLIEGWEPWAVPFLVASMVFAWWIHLKHPFSERGRVWAIAAVFYAVTFYQGAHESSLFDISLIMCFVFFMFSLADELRVFDVGIIVYFATLLYQIIFNYGLSIFTEPLTMSRMILHVLIVLLSVRFAKSMINGRQRSAEMQGRVIGQLSEINRRADDFMANVSHELRTPINAVTGLSAILSERGESGEEMESIYRAGHRLSEQVGDILDYTEIDNGRIIVSPEIYGIYSVVNDVISIFRAAQEERPVDMIIDVDAGVPSKLKGDARRLKKMLWHLIDNACKFTRAGGVYVRVTADKKSYGVNLNIEISDTGVGIPPDELHKISRGYYQADSGRTRSAGGMGLGLAIVYGFAHAMGGFVTINSTPGQGTTVRLSIPQTVVDPAPCMSVAEPEKISPACYIRSEKFKVPMVRDYYESMIANLVKGLRIPIRRAGSIDDLKNIAAQTPPTHIFTGREEYEEAPELFRELAEQSEIIVVADRTFALEGAERITILRKPFYGFPIAGILNALNIGGDIDPTDADVAVSFPGLKALVVDDEEMNLVVANGIFTGYGMRVFTALSGKEALSMFEREEFDVVFMDHMMPEMDGVEAMKLLRQTASGKNKGAEMVALTANAVSGAREMFLSEGFDGFLAKPIETRELERVLKKLLPPEKMRFELTGDAASSGQALKETEGEKLGIKRLLGDREFYGRLRRIFIQELPHNMRVFKSAYATGTMEPYAVRLRSLRDGARTIGEEGLARQARRLEQAIADGDSARIRREHMELCSAYETCVRALEAAERQEGGAL